jgi:Na+/proline symporter
LLVGIGGSVYPQAIQRIYAARSERTLQRSLAVMSLLPLLTTLVVFSLGITAIVHYPGLDKSGSDQVLALILKDVMVTGPLGYWTVVLLLAAVLAALMSTADSALLAISSMVSRDIYGGLINPEASEAAQTRLGKVTSWVVISAMVWVSTQEDLTLVRLLVIKFEVLIQVAPAFFLGVRWARLGGRAVFAGLVVGLCVSLGLWALGAKPAGFHPGIVGLVANVLTIVIVQRFDALPKAQV